MTDKLPFAGWRIWLVFFVLTMACFTNKVQASHAMGADLSYECIDAANGVYKITLRFYRDCDGIDAPPNIIIDVSSVSCGHSLTLDLQREPCPPATGGAKPCEVSPLCPGAIGQSTCNGGTLPGVQAFVYSATITLPSNCPDWVFSFSECCRNDQITNVVAASSEDLYVQATLNNVNGPNSSPVFTTLPVPFICANQPFSYNQGAIDADGDSIVYSLVNALGLGAAPVSYVGGFSPANPILTTPPNSMVFSGSTGQMSFTPNGIQVDVITVLVQEYRNGQLIGTTMRDIQVVVLNIPGCGVPPLFTGALAQTVQNGFYINPQQVQVCPGNNLAFSVLAYNPTGDSVYLQSNVTTAIPGGQLTTTYLSADSVLGQFTWVPGALDTGFNNLVFTVANNNCPIRSVQSYAVTIEVLAGTFAGPDRAYCPAGGPLQLQAYGGTQFSWQPTTGLSNAAVGNPLASPGQTTQYVVTSNLSSSCKNSDTVLVTVVPDFTFTTTQSDDTICRFEFVELSATAQAQFAPYTYQWRPNAGLSNAGVPNPVAQPDVTTNYVVTMVANNGCTIRDTLRVVVEGQGPQVSVTADRDKVCIGDTIQLTSNISLLPCGVNVVPCQGTFGIKAVGTGTTIDPNGATPYHGFYEDARIQFLYQAAELQAAGIPASTITDIVFNISQMNSTQPYTNFTIKMGCTNATQLNSIVPGLVTVMGPVSYTPTGQGPNTHTLDLPYDWDGFSNLIIEVCFDNNSWTQYDEVFATPTAFNSVVFVRADDQVGCNLLSNNLQVSVNRPNTQFVFCQPAPKSITYTWSPTTNLYVPDSLNPYVVLNANTTYYLNVNDGSCRGGGAVTLSLDTSFGVNAGPDVPFCAGVPVQLNATVTGKLPVGNLDQCGANGSPCGSGSVVKEYSPAGAATSSVTPFDGGFFLPLEDQRSQILYRAADLLAAGFTAGTINRVGLNVATKATAFPFQGLSIKLGCTSKTELQAGVWEPTTLVYTAATLATVAGWNDYSLQNTFDWDGVTNLVVEVCWDNPNGFPSSGADQVLSVITNYNSFQSFITANAVGCNLSASSASMYQSLPALRLRMCPAPAVAVTYSWQPSTGLSATDTVRPYAWPTTPTTYVVTAYFDGRCPKFDTVVVTPQNFTYSVTPDTAICSQAELMLQATGGNIYRWQPADSVTCDTCSSTLVRPETNSTYVVTIADTVTGCVVTDSVNVLVNTLLATAWFADTLVDQATPVTIGADVVSSTTNGLTYQWGPSSYLDGTANTSAVSTPLQDVAYVLTATAGGCTDTALVNVRVNIVASPVAMPNAFTPNADGRNDGFYPVVFNPLVAQVKAFRIYNRFGELIHNSTTPWDGTLRGAAQPAGVYVYYVLIERPLKGDEALQGEFTLLR